MRPPVSIFITYTLFFTLFQDKDASILLWKNFFAVTSAKKFDFSRKGRKLGLAVRLLSRRL